MTTATKILIDELVENSHFENVDDVIFWAMTEYKNNNSMSNYSLVCGTILDRIKEAESAAEKGENFVVQNYEVIEFIEK